MVSSLNHHISILKLTVHDAYLDFLSDGKLPDSSSQEHDWCRPKFQRSQWFDLFNADDRISAFRTLWAVMAYLTRPIETSIEQDVTMAGT